MVCDFLVCLSIWIWLMCSYDWKEVIHFSNYTTKTTLCLSHARGHAELHVLWLVMLNLIAWVRWYPPSCPTEKLIFFSFVTSKYLGVIFLEYLKIPFLLKLLPINFGIHQWFLSATIISMVFASWWIYYFLFISIFINWNYSVRKTFLFSSFIYLFYYLFLSVEIHG